jgi:lysophospholipase L1-like esterase
LSVAKLFAVNFAILVVLVALLEIGASTFAPRDLEAVFDNPDAFLEGRPFVRRDPVRGFALVPGFASGSITVNGGGFRGAVSAYECREGEWILALGESTTFGWLVRDEETYAARLQEILKETNGRAVPVVNGGVPSYTSSQVRLYLEELLAKTHPLAVIVHIAWNDALLACIDNWYPEILVQQHPAPWRRWLLEHSGVYRAIAICEPQHTSSEMPSPDSPLRAYRENLEEMIAIGRQARVPIFFVAPTLCEPGIPFDGMKVGARTVPKEAFIEVLRRYGAVLEGVAGERNVPVIDHPLGIDMEPSPRLFLDPVHPSAEGHFRLAEAIAAALDRARLFAGVAQS